MFVLRSVFWLGALTMLLPPTEGAAPPRVSLIHTAYSVRDLVQDIAGVCERNPESCAASRAAAGIARPHPAFADNPGRGTLTAADLQPGWALAAAPDRGS